MLCAQNAKSNEQNPIIKQLLQLPLFAAGPLAWCPDPCAMCTTPPFRDQDGRSTLQVAAAAAAPAAAAAAKGAKRRSDSKYFTLPSIFQMWHTFCGRSSCSTFVGFSGTMLQSKHLFSPYPETWQEESKNVVVQLLQDIQGCV